MASVIRRPSAFLPLAMSLTALAIVLCAVLHDVVTYGAIVRGADEGVAAHLWQLLMAGQLPITAFFAIKWLPRIPLQTLRVLALQAGAALAAIAPVYFLHL